MTHNDHVYNLNENIKYFFLKKSAKHICILINIFFFSYSFFYIFLQYKKVTHFCNFAKQYIVNCIQIHQYLQSFVSTYPLFIPFKIPLLFLNTHNNMHQFYLSIHYGLDRKNCIQKNYI